MGSRSPDGNGHRRSRKKDNRHSRSRSRSRERESRRKKSSKKSKHSRRSRSRSASAESEGRRKYIRSFDQTSDSKRSHRKSRSHSRSDSRTRRSHGSRSNKSSRSIKKSRSKSRESSRTRDSSRKPHEESSSHSKSSSSVTQGIEHMAVAQQAEMRLQAALKAAAAADEALKVQGVLASGGGRHVESKSFEDQQKRASVIDDIDSGEFTQTSFKSTRSEIPLPSGSSVDAFHAGAMFGSGGSSRSHDTANGSAKTSTVFDKDNLMHPSLYVSTEEKMDRWKQKLIALRRKKLESQAAAT